MSPTVGHAACAEKLQHPTLRRREELPGVHLGQYEGTDCRYATTNLMRRSSLPSPTRRLLQRMKTWLPRPPSPAPVIVCSEPAVTDMAPAPSNEHVAPAPAVTSAVRAWLIESSPTRRLLHQMNTLLQHRVTSAARVPVIEYAATEPAVTDTAPAPASESSLCCTSPSDRVCVVILTCCTCHH